MKEKAASGNSHPWAIEVEGLAKSFGDHLALKGVSLKIKRGEFCIVFGPNGAGKTTLIRVLATLSKPSAGRAAIDALDILDSPAEIRRRIGVVTHQTFLYDELTAYENLKFYGRMYDIPHLEERIHEVITMVGLASRLHHRVRTLSRGMQQRLSIARAVLHRPRVMLLDEPETGLDQSARAMLNDVLNTLNSSDRTVVMTTHSLERGFEMGDRIVILAEGKIVYEESKQALDVASLREVYQSLTGARR